MTWTIFVIKESLCQYFHTNKQCIMDAAAEKCGESMLNFQAGLESVEKTTFLGYHCPNVPIAPAFNVTTHGPRQKALSIACLKGPLQYFEDSETYGTFYLFMNISFKQEIANSFQEHLDCGRQLKEAIMSGEQSSLIDNALDFVRQSDLPFSTQTVLMMGSNTCADNKKVLTEIKASLLQCGDTSTKLVQATHKNKTWAVFVMKDSLCQYLETSKQCVIDAVDAMCGESLLSFEIGLRLMERLHNFVPYQCKNITTVFRFSSATKSGNWTTVSTSCRKSTTQYFEDSKPFGTFYLFMNITYQKSIADTMEDQFYCAQKLKRREMSDQQLYLISVAVELAQHSILPNTTQTILMMSSNPCADNKTLVKEVRKSLSKCGDSSTRITHSEYKNRNWTIFVIKESLCQYFETNKQCVMDAAAENCGESMLNFLAGLESVKKSKFVGYHCPNVPTETGLNVPIHNSGAMAMGVACLKGPMQYFKHSEASGTFYLFMNISNKIGIMNPFQELLDCGRQLQQDITDGKQSSLIDNALEFVLKSGFPYSTQTVLMMGSNPCADNKKFLTEIKASIMKCGDTSTKVVQTTHKNKTWAVFVIKDSLCQYFETSQQCVINAADAKCGKSMLSFKIGLLLTEKLHNFVGYHCKNRTQGMGLGPITQSPSASVVSTSCPDGPMQYFEDSSATGTFYLFMNITLKKGIHNPFEEHLACGQELKQPSMSQAQLSLIDDALRYVGRSHFLNMTSDLSVLMMRSCQCADNQTLIAEIQSSLVKCGDNTTRVYQDTYLNKTWTVYLIQNSFCEFLSTGHQCFVNVASEKCGESFQTLKRKLLQLDRDSNLTQYNCGEHKKVVNFVLVKTSLKTSGALSCYDHGGPAQYFVHTGTLGTYFFFAKIGYMKRKTLTDHRECAKAYQPELNAQRLSLTRDALDLIIDYIFPNTQQAVIMTALNPCGHNRTILQQLQTKILLCGHNVTAIHHTIYKGRAWSIFLIRDFLCEFFETGHHCFVDAAREICGESFEKFEKSLSELESTYHFARFSCPDMATAIARRKFRN